MVAVCVCVSVSIAGGQHGIPGPTQQEKLIKHTLVVITL